MVSIDVFGHMPHLPINHMQKGQGLHVPQLLHVQRRPRLTSSTLQRCSTSCLRLRGGRGLRVTGGRPAPRRASRAGGPPSGPGGRGPPGPTARCAVRPRACTAGGRHTCRGGHPYHRRAREPSPPSQVGEGARKAAGLLTGCLGQPISLPQALDFLLQNVCPLGVIVPRRFIGPSSFTLHSPFSILHPKWENGRWIAAGVGESPKSTLPGHS